MTVRETERLAKVEQNQQNTNAKLDYLIERFDKYVEAQGQEKERLSQKFITRAEAVAVGVIFSIAVTLIGLWFNLQEHIK